MSTTARATTRPRALDDWLRWQEGLHPRAIDMGLERVRTVAQRLELLPFPARTVTVAGTNGKGSCALCLAHLLGFESKVGVYTSPYLRRYNERVRIAGNEASDADLCAAFAAVEAARGDVSLTYFEFGTLAALWLFARAQVDISVLEVGMGGRLDAVNIVDADVALITNIGLDHCDWLGPDREHIGREKAGILRKGQAAVCADRDPPASLTDTARQRGTALRRIGADFDLHTGGNNWRWCDWGDVETSLAPVPGMLADNYAAVLAVLRTLDALPDPAVLDARMAGFAVPGRRQTRPGTPPIVLDVAHNTEAMQVLAAALAAQPVAGDTHVIFGMLANKPVARASAALSGLVSHAYAAGLPGVVRGLSGAELAAQLAFPATVHADVRAALAQARSAAGDADRIVVCGSFHTVAAALEVLDG